MKASAYLLLAASYLDRGEVVPKRFRDWAPAFWTEYIALTLPDPYEFNSADIRETRVLRFLLAAAMARDAGE